MPLAMLLAELYFDRGNFYDFTSLGTCIRVGQVLMRRVCVCAFTYDNLSPLCLLVVRELDIPGEISERKIYPFEFQRVEMPYESYNGVNVRLRYATTCINYGIA